MVTGFLALGGLEESISIFIFNTQIKIQFWEPSINHWATFLRRTFQQQRFVVRSEISIFNQEGEEKQLCFIPIYRKHSTPNQ